MNHIFKLTERPQSSLFFARNDAHDARLGEIVSANPADYEKSEIVILGCPQDDGVVRNRGRSGAAAAPDEIRRAFYKLSNFGITADIFDLGNTIVQSTLEETHEIQTEIVRELLRDNKKIISLGGGNDISYPDARALSEIVGSENVLALNIDQHFDVRADVPRNSGTPYRQLLEEQWILPEQFYELAYQPQANSPVYFEYLNNLGARSIDLEAFRDSQYLHDRFTNMLFASQSTTINAIFWGFDVDSVRAADAPGTSAPSSVGLTAEEFCFLAQIAGGDGRTKIIEFTEVNPNFDVDNRTVRLVATAMHKFCAATYS